MAQRKNIQFHSGETWDIPFTCKDADGNPIALDADTEVLFRISNAPSGSTALLTLAKSLGEITVVDEATGSGLARISPAQQVTATLRENKTYRYELKVIRSGADPFVSVQCIGELADLDSLFTPV